ncbi:hypothetical protein NW765_017549 [Fusarium oxysporum]|nr:hypothetical protein NW765_017549 [Fusarium oxysporum]KAJ4263702.1 hypothetical protein NW764_016084 [Fusarium oxysporum]
MGLVDELQLCTNAVLSLVLDLPIEELLSVDGMKNDKYFQEYQRLGGAANGAKAATPLWVSGGEDDSFLRPYSVLEPAVKACSYGNKLDVRVYPGMDHEPAIYASMEDWIPWIEDRFDGIRRHGGCTNITKTPFNLATAKSSNVWAEYLDLAASIPSD